MARRMEYVAEVNLPNNDYWYALTCPAGHKYEVLEVVVDLGSVPGQTVAPLLATALGFFTVETHGDTSAYAAVRFSYNALVLTEGDSFIVIAFGDGDELWQGYVVYMDVTF